MPRVPPKEFQFTSDRQPAKRRPRGPEDVLRKIEKLLRRTCPRDRAGRRWEDVIAEAVLVQIVRGNGTVFKEMARRWWGDLDGLPQAGDHTFIATISAAGVISCKPLDENNPAAVAGCLPEEGEQ